MAERNHFWVGSDCRVGDPNPKYPDQVSSVSDIITLTGDIGNHVPDKSWMLYLFEFFIDRTKKIPLELDLTCSFNNDGKFDAIFGGHNQYQFQKVLPAVGHSYVREIVVNPVTRQINYEVTDMNTGVHETFELVGRNIKDIEQILEWFNVNDVKEIKFEGADHFTGLEWWNLVGDNPYPIRYKVMISLLQYGLHDSSDSRQITYYPYNSLTPDNDQNSKRYPISFQNSRVMRGCICYNVNDGDSNTGLTFNI